MQLLALPSCFGLLAALDFHLICFSFTLFRMMSQNQVCGGEHLTFRISGLLFAVIYGDIWYRMVSRKCLKKNLNAPRPSEHPPVWGEKCQNV